MTYTLVINPHGIKSRVSTHSNLRDARAALIRHQVNRGLRITIQPWKAKHGQATQYGDLLAGMDIVGAWQISYPLGRGAKLPSHAVEKLPA